MDKKAFRHELVETIIGKESKLQGYIHSLGSVRIDGNIEGEINCQGELHIGKDSKIKANIFAKKIVIAGEVIGNVEAVHDLEITRTGRVYGNITGDRLIIDEGAIYRGRVNMDVISAKNIYEGDIEIKKLPA